MRKQSESAVDFIYKVSHKRIMKAKSQPNPFQKKTKATKLNKTKEIENNIFTHCLAF